MSTMEQATFDNLDDLFRHELYQRLLGWTQARWLIATFLLLVSIYYRPTLGLPYPLIPVLGLVMLCLFFNAATYFFLQRNKWLPRLLHAQVAMDLLVVSWVVHLTGGADSRFQWFYLFVIVATGLVAGLKYSVLTALLSTLLYGLVLWGHYNFIIPHIPVGDLATYSLSGFRDKHEIIRSFTWHAFIFIGLGALSGYVAETAEKRKRQLAEADRFYRRSLLRNITQAEEKERKRISRDLHDEIGQYLTVILYHLQALEENFTMPPEAQARIQNLQQLLQESTDSLHRAIADLRPPLLDDLGLVSSIRWYTDKYIKPLGISVSIRTYGQPARLDEVLEINLYRVFQESLTNIVRHSQASEIAISIRFTPAEILISVQDDGVGFAQEAAGTGKGNGWGITGIKERIAMVNGRLDLASKPGKGTNLTITVPTGFNPITELLYP